MIDLEKERKKIELGRVAQARAEMEFQILERLAEIERIKVNIEIQKQRELELKKILGGENG